MKPVALVLSGSGRADGSEISEAVFIILSCSQLGLPLCMYAPDMVQADVMDHLVLEAETGSRNVLTESARIARSNIRPLDQLDIDHHSAILFPGGLGAVKNWCTYHRDGVACTVQPDVLRVIRQSLAVRLPLGFICISPVLAARVAHEDNIPLELTIGNEAETIKDIEALGCTHIKCDVRHVHVDAKYNVVSTPAYMLAQTAEESYAGIHELVREIAELVEQ